jgi:hypothetical protein
MLNPDQFGDYGDFGYMAMDQHRRWNTYNPDGNNKYGELQRAIIPKEIDRISGSGIYVHNTEQSWDTRSKIVNNHPRGRIMKYTNEKGNPSMYRMTPKLSRPPV